MALIIKGMELPKGCWNCPFRLSGMMGAVCLCKGGTLEVNLDRGVDDNCPLRSVDDLTDYVEDSFRVGDGIAKDKYWHHNTVLRVIKRYFEGRRDRDA